MPRRRGLLNGADSTDGPLGSASTTPASRNAVAKSMQLLAAMVDGGRPEYGVRELAGAAALPPSSVHRLLTALERQGFVQQAPAGRYRLGLEFFRLAWQATKFGVRDAALPVLEELARDCNETALLGLYDRVRRQMMFVASVEADHPLRYVVQLNQWVPIHCGASGLAILAFLPVSEQRAIIDGGLLAAETAKTITEPAALHRELERVRKRGYACSIGQRILGAVGIAAPIWDSSGEVVGDVMLTMPEQRFDASNERRLGGRVREAAQGVTQLLGGTVGSES